MILNKKDFNFPFSPSSLSPEWIWSVLNTYLTPERKKKIEQIVQSRCYSIFPVLENIYDYGNQSAVLRTTEGLGFGQACIIQETQKIKISQRTSSGADKWLEIIKFQSTQETLNFLKQKNIKIISTTISNTAIDLQNLKLDGPTAIVFGNEHTGVSSLIKDSSDFHLQIPIKGFVQSFNISVAAAIILWKVHELIWNHNPHLLEITKEEQTYLKALYAIRTLDSAPAILKDHYFKKVTKNLNNIR